MHPNRGRDWPIDQIRTWIEQGRTMAWIGDQLGTTDQRISILCRKHAIPVHRRGPRVGPGHPNWKGGRVQDVDGYWLVWVADHPGVRARSGRAGTQGYVAEHRLVVEAHLGRYLLPGEVVHHRNGVKDDNRPENLEVFASNGEHLAHELAGRCPKWTPEGRARILASVRQRRPKTPKR